MVGVERSVDGEAQQVQVLDLFVVVWRGWATERLPQLGEGDVVRFVKLTKLFRVDLGVELGGHEQAAGLQAHVDLC